MMKKISVNINIMVIAIILSSVIFVGLLTFALINIIERENIELREQAITCLQAAGSTTIIFEGNMTIHYETAWEISKEELRALSYLSNTYNIILITR